MSAAQKQERVILQVVLHDKGFDVAVDPGVFDVEGWVDVIAEIPAFVGAALNLNRVQSMDIQRRVSLAWNASPDAVAALLQIPTRGAAPAAVVDDLDEEHTQESDPVEDTESDGVILLADFQKAKR